MKHRITLIKALRNLSCRGVLALLLSASSAQAELISNGGFETNTGANGGNATGWTKDNSAYGIYNESGHGGAHGGSWAYVPGSGAFITAGGYQTLASPLVAGQQYTLSFYQNPWAASNGNDVRVGKYNSGSRDSDGSYSPLPLSVMSVSTVAAGNWERKSYTFTAVGGEDTVYFGTASAGNNNGADIDDVSLTEVPLSLSVSVTAPANGQAFLEGSSVTATVSVANGTAPYSVTFYTKGASAWSTNNTSDTLFTIPLGTLAVGTYTNYAMVTDNTSATNFSATNTFTVFNLGNTGTGGTITYTDSNGVNPTNTPYIGGYVVHTFTNSGTLSIPVPASAAVLVVAGGGGGGGALGGGGGGGGVVALTAVPVVAWSNYAVVVGTGGAGGFETTLGVTGLASRAFGAVAAGGGGGGYYSDQGGLAGGSGGGAGAVLSSTPSGGASSGSSLGGLTGTIYGNRGGNQTHTRNLYPRDPPTSARGGGGAGAAAADENANDTPGGTGGAGITNAILGPNYYWGGGGGGGCYNSYAGGNGGLGGGGGGSSFGGSGTTSGGGSALNSGTGGTNGGAAFNGGAGGANTGGGGGGGSWATGGSGGSGIVIVRYPYGPLPPSGTLISFF